MRREPVAVRAQEVHGQEVDRGADVLVGQRGLVRITRRARAIGVDTDHVQVVRVHVARVSGDGLDPFEPRDSLVVDLDLAAANRTVPFDLVELHERDRREHVAEVRLVAGHGDVVQRAVSAPHHPQVVERVGEIVAVGCDQPALAGRDVLRRVEREARQVGDRADLAAAVSRLGGVRRILDDRQAERRERVEVGGLTVEVDRDDRLRPLADERPHLLGIDVQRLVEHVREDGRGATVDDDIRRRRPRERGGDHLVAGTDAERDERQVERRGARRDREDVLRLEIVAHPRLELCGARARRQPARSQRLRDGRDLLLGDRRRLERQELSSLGGELRHPR